MSLKTSELSKYEISAIKWLKNEQEFVPDGSRVKAFLNDDGTFGLIFEATEAADKGPNSIAKSKMSTEF